MNSTSKAIQVTRPRNFGRCWHGIRSNTAQDAGNGGSYRRRGDHSNCSRATSRCAPVTAQNWMSGAAAAVCRGGGSPPAPCGFGGSSDFQKAAFSPRILLLRRHMKFRADHRLDSFFTGQPQTEQVAFLFEVDVKIEKRAALSFGSDPIGQLRNRNARRAELEFVAPRRFDDFIPHRNDLGG